MKKTKQNKKQTNLPIASDFFFELLLPRRLKSPKLLSPGMLKTDDAAAAVAEELGGAITCPPPPPPPKQFIMGLRGLLGSASFKMFTVLLPRGRMSGWICAGKTLS